jgi:hypothetical protein
MTEMRGSAPTAECLAQWETTTTTTTTMEPQNGGLMFDESFATAVVALAAFALYS